MADPFAWTTIEDALRNWIVGSSGFADDHVVWAQQNMPRPTDPWISLNIQTVQEVGLDWTDYENNPFSFADLTVASVDTVGDALAITAHGLNTGDGPVRLTAPGTAPGGLAISTDYWVVKVDADHIQLATTFLNARVPTVIDITSAGAGVLKIVSTPNTEKFGQEMAAKTRGMWIATMSITCFAVGGAGTTDAFTTLSRVMFKVRTGPVVTALNNVGIGINDFSPIKSIGQAISSTIFEPRATTTFKFYLAGELEDYTTYIARVYGTNQITAKSFTVERPGS